MIIETKPGNAYAGHACVGIFLLIKMKKLRESIGKKGFISDPLVDIWAVIIFIIVIIIFAFIYKATATSKMETLQDKRDITYGNYIAQVYLEKQIKPTNNDGETMSMAEIISFYDYKKSVEARKSTTIVEKIRKFVKGDPIEESIADITDKFVKSNMNSKGCYVFAIKGNDFEKGYIGAECEAVIGYFTTKLIKFTSTWTIGPAVRAILTRNKENDFYFKMQPYLKKIPKYTFVTYIAPLDPRSKPIELHVIYDFERMLSVYSSEQEFKEIDVRRITEEEQDKQIAAK